MQKHIDMRTKQVLDYLLSELAQRLHGSLDIWTIVCSGEIVQSPHQFLQDQCGIMNSFIIVTKATLKSAVREKTVSNVLSEITSGYKNLQNTFFLLENFKNLSSEEIHEIIDVLRNSYREVMGAIVKLGKIIDCNISYLDNLKHEHEQYYENIMQKLYVIFSRHNP